MLRGVTDEIDPRTSRREQIVETALRIADRDGFEGLTMRKLASELGVSAPIVYRHFEDKAAIIDAIVETLVAREQLEDRANSSPRDWLYTTFSAMYSDLSAHPGLLDLLASAGPFTEHAMRITDEVLAALEQEGLDPEHAAWSFRWLMGFTIGAVTLERGAGQSLGAGLPEMTPLLKRFPRLFMAGANLGGARGKQGYQWALERMLDAVQAQAQSAEPKGA